MRRVAHREQLQRHYYLGAARRQMADPAPHGNSCKTLIRTTFRHEQTPVEQCAKVTHHRELRRGCLLCERLSVITERIFIAANSHSECSASQHNVHEASRI